MKARALPLPVKRFLTRDEAAEYLGVSARLFDAEVAAKRWPDPIRRGATERAKTWDRCALDHAADVLSGLIAPSQASEAGGMDQSVMEALERARHAATP